MEKAIAKVSAGPGVIVLSDEAMDAVQNNLKQFVKFKTKLMSPQDIMKLDGKEYIKRDGWAKLGMALNINFEQVADPRKLEAADSEGSYYIWMFKFRASAPNGRFIEQWGACSSRDPFFSKKHGERINPNESDIIHTAETAAIDRCMSILLGGSGLSEEALRGVHYESVTFPRKGDGTANAATEPVKPPARQAEHKPQPEIPPTGDATGDEMISAKQLKYIGTLMTNIGMKTDQGRKILAERYNGKLSRKELTKKDASDFIEYLLEEEKLIKEAEQQGMKDEPVSEALTGNDLPF